MEVKIGIQHAPREIVFRSSTDPDELLASIAEAHAAGTTITLVDDKGGKVLVPADKIAFVEVGAPTIGRVGFGA